MRRAIFSVVLAANLICFNALAAPAGKYPAADAYNDKLKAIVNKALHSALMKHKDRLNGLAMKTHYVVDRDGHVHNVRVTSQTHDKAAEKIVTDTIAAITFPPVPSDVQIEVGAGYFEVEGELSLAADALTASKFETPAAYEYNMLVHRILTNDLKPSFHAPHRLEVDYEFYLNSEGRVVSMNVHAKAGGRAAEQIISRSIQRIKCPPIPPKVFRELEQKPPLRIFGTMTWDPA